NEERAKRCPEKQPNPSRVAFTPASGAASQHDRYGGEARQAHGDLSNESERVQEGPLPPPDYYWPASPHQFRHAPPRRIVTRRGMRTWHESKGVRVSRAGDPLVEGACPFLPTALHAPDSARAKGGWGSDAPGVIDSAACRLADAIGRARATGLGRGACVGARSLARGRPRRVARDFEGGGLGLRTRAHRDQHGAGRGRLRERGLAHCEGSC